jgi:hypothetical protein
VAAGALAALRPDSRGEGFQGGSPSAIRSDLVELSMGQYRALVELTTVLGRMHHGRQLPEELKAPFDRVLTAFGV